MPIRLETLSQEEIQDLAEDDPEAFKEASDRYDRKIDNTYQRYAEKNLSFDAMWKSGEIQAYIKTHLGHNAISAHQALIRSPLQAQHDPALQNSGQHGLTGTIAARLSQRRQGTRQVLRQGEVMDEQPPGSAPDIIPTMPGEENFQEVDEPVDEPEEINVLVGDGDPVKED